MAVDVQSPIELLAHARLAMRAQASAVHAAGRELVAWQHRAADALASDDETEARQLLTVAAMWLYLEPSARELMAWIDQAELVNRAELARQLLEGAADRIAAAAELVSQDCVRGRLPELAAECRFTAGAVGGPDAAA